ncbi:MAG: cytochrome b/b6 domain-containing protein [Moorella humiferrea]|nr:cytochrome b/b6 domain-containing protein [Moorella humiferrea]
MPEEKVERFNLFERLGHWSHGITFVVLLLTGLALVFRGYAGLLGPGGLRLFRGIHHAMAYPFTFLTVIILLLGTPRTFLQWLRECFTWGRDDFRFIFAFPREFFGLKAELPEQGKFNAGEKLNSLLTIFGSILMAATGWILLLRDSFSPAVVSWALPLHSAGALLMGGVLLGHVYLALGHPNSRESINGMLSGKVSAKFAREHHGRWYRELKVGEKRQEKQAKIA